MKLLALLDNYFKFLQAVSNTLPNFFAFFDYSSMTLFALQAYTTLTFSLLTLFSAVLIVFRWFFWPVCCNYGIYFWLSWTDTCPHWFNWWSHLRKIPSFLPQLCCVWFDVFLLSFCGSLAWAVLFWNIFFISFTNELPTISSTIQLVGSEAVHIPIPCWTDLKGSLLPVEIL